MSGYAHETYATSFADLGMPRRLPECGGWLIVRAIPGEDTEVSGLLDAMGCYPMFSCLDWTGLTCDLAAVGRDLISIAMVTDPFGNYTEPQLRDCFPDLFRPFKDHFVVDLRQPRCRPISDHHRRNVVKAHRHVQVERCQEPERVAGVWAELYEGLIARHHVRGLAAFSPAALTRQLQVPGAVVFRADDSGATIGITVWYTNARAGYYHLGAYSDAGYRAGASFALFDEALKYFAEIGLDWLDLGAAPGLDSDGRDGLSRFKRGWATGTRPVYLCGRILDRPTYAALAESRGVSGTTYFPAYRDGEYRSLGLPRERLSR